MPHYAFFLFRNPYGVKEYRLKELNKKKNESMKFLTLVFISFSFISVAQQPEDIDFIIPYEKDGLWGYMNGEKEIITIAEFEEAYPLQYGMGRVKKKGKYGYVNRFGEIAIKPKYKEAKDFSCNGGRVRKGKKTFNIDSEGEAVKWVSPCGSCLEFDCYYLDSKWRKKDYEIIQNSNGKYGIIISRKIKKNQNEIVEFQDTLQPSFDKIIKLAFQIIYFEKNGRIDLIDDGAIHFGAQSILDRLDFRYEEMKVFHCYDNPKTIHKIIGLKKGGLWGYVDLTRPFLTPIEEIVTKFKYVDVFTFEKFYAIVEYKPNRFGYIDREGTEYFMEE